MYQITLNVNQIESLQGKSYKKNHSKYSNLPVHTSISFAKLNKWYIHIFAIH